MRQTAFYRKLFILSLGVTLFIYASARLHYSQRRNPPPCYAFIRQGALALDCDNALTASVDLGIEGFAVSDDGKWLVLKRAATGRRTGGAPQQTNSSKLILLSNNKIRDLEFDPDTVSASCGILLAFHGGNGAVDLINAAPFVMSSYTSFRCNNTKSTVVGYIEAQRGSDGSGRDLWTGLESKTLVTKANAYRAFDVSPNGHYIGFATIHGGVVDTVCIANDHRKPECIGNLILAGSNISVSDSGHVLFEQSTGEECLYEDSFHFAPVGKDSSRGSRDACVAVFSWQAGQGAPTAVQKFGRSPQWVQSPIALRAWLRQQLKL